MPSHTSVVTLSDAVRAALARLTHTDPTDWFLTFRARHGIEAVLQSLADERGAGEVITQPFTCATAINPIMSAGHTPTYIDCRYHDLSLDTDRLVAHSTSRGLIMQHSFGIVSDMQRARVFADKHGVLLLEDSAHQIGLMARDDADMPLADVSVHSFGVEKFLPTKFGGAVWVNPRMTDRSLRHRIEETLSNMPVLDNRTDSKAHRYKWCNALLNRTPRQLEPSLRRLLVSTGVFEPAIMPDELLGKNHHRPARPSRFMLETMLDGLQNYDTTITTRRRAARVYRQHLPASLIPSGLAKDCAPARFPIIAPDSRASEQLFSDLRRTGYYSGKWYRPVIFPGTPRPELYHYTPTHFPVAEDISGRIVNLPTNITAEKAKEIARVIVTSTHK